MTALIKIIYLKIFKGKLEKTIRFLPITEIVSFANSCDWCGHKLNEFHNKSMCNYLNR